MIGGFRERLGAFAYVFGWTVLRRLPARAARAVLRTAADLAWVLRGSGVRQLEANLGRVVAAHMPAANLRDLTRAAMRSYCRYWLEVFRLPAASRREIESRFHLYDAQRLWEALGTGRGAVVALPHSGNWDHAGAWVSLCGYRVTTVAERVRPEALYRRFVALRERLGMELLPLTGGGDVYGVLADRLRAGGLVCLLADRDLAADGVEVSFFGEAARMPAGPAALAIDTGAALLPVSLWFEGRGIAGRVHEEVAIPSYGRKDERVGVMTQAVATALEEGIAAYPQDWHMLQPVWTADLARPVSDDARPVGDPRRRVRPLGGKGGNSG